MSLKTKFTTLYFFQSTEKKEDLTHLEISNFSDQQFAIAEHMKLENCRKSLSLISLRRIS